MKFRRYLALVLALAMLLSMAAPALALAEDNPLDLGGELEVTAEGGDIQDVVDAGEIDLSGGAGEAAAETFTVTFMVGDAVFATQTVAKDGYPVQPETAPEAEGSVFAYWHLETEEASDYFASPVAIGSDTVLIAAFTEAEAPSDEQPEDQPEETPAEEQPEQQPEETPAEQQPEEQPEETPAEQQPEETPAEQQPEETPAEQQPEEQPEETPEQPAEEQPEQQPEETTEEEQTEVEIPEEPQAEAEQQPAEEVQDQPAEQQEAVQEQQAASSETEDEVDVEVVYEEETVDIERTDSELSDRFVFKNGSLNSSKEVDENNPFTIKVDSQKITVQDQSVTSGIKTLYLWADGQKPAYSTGSDLRLEVDGHITFRSSNPEIATVTSSNGYLCYIRPVKDQSGEITVNAYYDEELVASAPVIVNYVGVTTITPSAASITLGKGDTLFAGTFKNRLTFDPADATITSVKFDTSSSGGVITVTENKITAVGSGQAEVRVISNDFSGASCTVPITVEGEGPFSIGDQSFNSLQEAFDSIADYTGDPVTIKMNKDWKGGGIATDSRSADNYPKNVILDLNGHTYTVISGVGSKGYENQAIHLGAGSKLTIKNGSIVAKPTIMNSVVMFAQVYGDLTLDNVVLDGTKVTKGKTEDMFNYNKGNSTIKGNTKIILPSDTNMTINLDVSTLEVDGATVSGGPFVVRGGTAPEAPGQLTIKNGVFEEEVDYGSTDGNNINVSGATFVNPVPSQDCEPGFYPLDNGDGTYTVTKQAVAFVEAKDLAYLTFKDAVDEAEGEVITLLKDVDTPYQMRDETLKVKRMGFNLKVLDPENTKLKVNVTTAKDTNDNNIITIYDTVEAVASITKGEVTTYYEELRQAVEEAESGDTIVMINNSKEGYFDIPETANVTVDLNGKIVELQPTQGGGFGMNVKGKLTIKDTEGEGQFSSDSTTTVQSTGDLTICDDVELGSVNIDGGKFSATGNAEATYLSPSGSGEVSISGNASVDGIDLSGSGKVSISGNASVGYIDCYSKDAEIAVSGTAQVDNIWVSGAKVNVSGAPVIQSIWLSGYDGVYSVINVVEGGLTSGASICVSTNYDRLLDGPVFITNGLNAASVEDVKKYFSSANAAIELSCLNNEAVLQIKETDWVKLQKLINNAEKGATLKLEQDYAYTKEDVIGDLEVRGKELTIDLNGHAIDAKSSGENALFWDAVITLEDSKLTIKDSKGGGKITGGSECGIQLWDESTFTMTGGSITGNKGTGVDVSDESTFTMSGGSITGNEGRGVYVSDESTFTMTGGEITKNTAEGGNGAGVYVKNGSTFTMSGGSITGNKASQEKDDDDVYGGQGGGVYVNYNATFNVSGNPTITGNTAEDGANVYLRGEYVDPWGSYNPETYEPIEVTYPAAIITVTGALSGAKIGVTTEAKPSEQNGVVTFTKDYAKYNAGKDPADVFTSDDAKYATGWNDAETEGVLGLEIKATATGYTGVYDGKAHAGATVTVTAPKSGATVTYSKDGKTYAKDAPTYTDAGEYTVYYKVAAKGYAMKKGVVTARITKAESKVTVTAEGWTYGEAAKTPTVSGYNGDGKITFLYAKAASANGEYAANAGETYSETVPSDAGDYLVKASIAATANYAAVESDPASFTIAKAKLTIVADAKSKYEGEADPELTYTAKGLVGSDKLTGALTRAAGEAVGAYPITLGTLTAGDNYEIAFTGANFTIKAKPAASKGIFLVTAKASGSKCLKVTWTALKDARVDGYDVFMADCGQDDHGPFKLVRSVTAATRSVKLSGLKKQTAYKVMIKAFDIQDGKKVYIGESAQVAHAYTDGGSNSHTNPKSISLNKTKVSLKVGEKFNIKATVKGLKSGKKVLAHGGLVRYVSSDKSVATVSATGRITAVGAGKCKVYAVTANGIYKAVSVTVKGSGTPTGIAFKGSAYSVKKGKTLKLGSQVKLTPSGAKTSLTWKSSDKKIATVDKNGKVKGLKKGTVTITVKTANGLTASVKVKVN